MYHGPRMISLLNPHCTVMPLPVQLTQHILCYVCFSTAHYAVHKFCISQVTMQNAQYRHKSARYSSVILYVHLFFWTNKRKLTYHIINI